MRIRACVRSGVLLAIVLSWGCVVAPSSSGSPPSALATDYRLAPPDAMDIIVRGVDPVIERTVSVRPDGKISFDLIGELLVSGKTVAEVRGELADRLKEFIVAPDVTVLLQLSSSRKYYIFGEVNRVGAFPLVGEVTAVEALAAAGGPTILGSPNAAWLARPGAETRTVYRVRYDDITRGNDSTNYTLQAGDVIYVPPGVSAQIGNVLRVIFYPLQQIIGLGGRFVSPGRP